MTARAFVVRAHECVDDRLTFRAVVKRTFRRTVIHDLVDEVPHKIGNGSEGPRCRRFRSGYPAKSGSTSIHSPSARDSASVSVRSRSDVKRAIALAFEPYACGSRCRGRFPRATYDVCSNPWPPDASSMRTAGSSSIARPSPSPRAACWRTPRDRTAFHA